MAKYQLFVKIDKRKWFFKMLSVPLLNIGSKAGYRVFREEISSEEHINKNDIQRESEYLM